MRLTHHYPATRLPDGSYEIRDLDIFAECSRLNPHTGEVDIFDADWLRAAADQGNARQGAGYLAPVHLGHHDPLRDNEPPFAGFLRDLRVDDGESDNESDDDSRAVLRATITGIPGDVFARIRDTRLPYRSVEIHAPDDPEISSLALLETTVPFHKFPLTRVREDADAAGDASADESDLPWDDGEPGAEDERLVASATASPPGVQFRETADHHLECVGRFAGSNDEERAHLLMQRLRDMLAELRDADGDAEGADDARTFTDEQLTTQIRALANAGYVFAEPAVRALAATSTDPAQTFAALRETLPQAPVADARAGAHPPSDADATPSGDRVVDELLHEIGRRDDATRRAAEAASREFTALEPRFRAIGCRFTRADFIRSRIAPVCIELGN